MARARELLGVRQEWLGFHDSGFPEGDPPPRLTPGDFATLDVEEAAKPLIRLMREQRPHVVVTYDEKGGYPHPDHVMTHNITVFAFDAAGDPDRYPELGEPWQPLKLYYHLSFHKQRIVALHEAMVARELESPYGDWLHRWVDEPEDVGRLTTMVPCADYFGVRDQALIAHETQIDPNSSWFACPVDLQQQVWPTEDYQLARTLVDTHLPEDDLFAGVRAGVPGVPA
jgi:mycothiol S-conjugate amidase